MILAVEREILLYLIIFEFFVGMFWVYFSEKYLLISSNYLWVYKDLFLESTKMWI